MDSSDGAVYAQYFYLTPLGIRGGLVLCQWDSTHSGGAEYPSIQCILLFIPTSAGLSVHVILCSC